MTKETVRYPDEVVEHVEEVVDEDLFESKSEFYRFSAEYLLDEILPEYDPETFDFEEILESLQTYSGSTPSDDDGFNRRAEFTTAVAKVRKLAHREEYAEAESYIDNTYSADWVESVLLEDILAQYRVDTPTV